MVSPVSPCALRLSGRLYVLSVVAILLLVANHPLGAEDPQALSNEPYFVELRQADRRHDDFAARLEQLVSEIADDHVEVRELWVARSQLYLKIELPALPQDDVEAVLAEINDHPLVERVIAAAVAPHEIRHQERLKKYATIAEIEAGELRGFRPKNRDYWPDLSREHDGRILLKYLEAEVSTPERRQQAEVRVARIHAEFEARVERTMTLGGVPVEVVALPEDVRIEDALAAYLASEDIQYAHPDYIYRNMLDATPNDLPSLPGGGLWGLYKISAPSAWDTRTSSGSVVVAVADTGVDYGHPDLAGNMWTNGSGHHGYNAVAGNSTPLDDHSHGTHVTGTIGAVGNNALDVVGVCWQTSLMAIKVQNSGSLSQPSWIAAGLDFARLNGANIVNASWNCPDDIVIREAFEDLRDAGIIVVNSAGNATTDNDAVLTYPRAYGFPNVLVVGNSDSNDAKFNTSNHGRWSVDVFAPGTGILSTFWRTIANTATVTGTSMAAPHAAGLLALAKAQFPGESARELVDRARFSVDPVAGLSSYCMSGGRINVAAALGDRPRMTNASGLVQVNTGAAVAIAGISIGGSSSKRVLFRAWGPSLASVGVTGHMSNPQITVFNAGGSSIGSNNDWGSLSLADRNEIATYGLTPLNSLDSAWIGTLAPGSYSVHLAGVGGTTGIGLIEAFDVDGSNVNRLVNTSVRAHVTSGQPAVGGLIVQGSKPRQVYIRVWGPSLTALGISGALSDPIATLYDSMSNVVATNDDWAAFDSTSTALETRLIELGSAPQHNKDAAIVAKLNPGAYTLHVSGVGGASGIALFEFSEY